MHAGDCNRMLPDGRHLTRWGSYTRVMISVRVRLVLGGTAAYVGLAILGWGMASFFLQSVALAVALSVLAGVSLFAGGNLSPSLHEDRGNRWAIVVLALRGLLAASLLEGMLPLILGRIVVVWWIMSNRPGLHEGVPCVPKG